MLMMLLLQYNELNIYIQLLHIFSCLLFVKFSWNKVLFICHMFSFEFLATHQFPRTLIFIGWIIKPCI